MVAITLRGTSYKFCLNAVAGCYYQLFLVAPNRSGKHDASLQLELMGEAGGLPYSGGVSAIHSSKKLIRIWARKRSTAAMLTGHVSKLVSYNRRMLSGLGAFVQSLCSSHNLEAAVSFMKSEMVSLSCACSCNKSSGSCSTAQAILCA